MSMDSGLDPSPKLLGISVLIILVISLLIGYAANAQCAESSNVNQLQALAAHMKPKYETVPLNADRPWVQVSAQDKDFYTWHARLPADGELVDRGANE
jgi:hypothetical protein